MRAAIGDIIHILKAGTCHVVFMHSSAEPMIAEIRAAVPTLREIVCLDAASAHGQSLAAWLGDVTDDPLDLRLPDTTLGFQGATGGTTGRSKLTQADNRFGATCIAAWSSYFRFSEPEGHSIRSDLIAYPLAAWALSSPSIASPIASPAGVPLNIPA